MKRKKPFLKHVMPLDLRKIFISFPSIHVVWEGITPLAQNEWICWIESAKKLDTRNHRIKRMCEELLDGRRRPCCWAGCIHRVKNK